MADNSMPNEAGDLSKQDSPIAVVAGEPLLEKPQDLFIPPDALTVFLNAFEGPLDLLLYLIRKHKFDILDLPVSRITAQYMEYVDLMKELNLDLAAEYLLMAAILAEIKSRMLLPVEVQVEDESLDPRADLVARLKEYELLKQGALEIEQLPRLERDVFVARALRNNKISVNEQLPQLELGELTLAFVGVVKRLSANASHHISRESLSTRQRMSQILTQLGEHAQLLFHQLFESVEGISGAVVAFLAILQLAKEQLIGIAVDGVELAIFKLEFSESTD